MGVMVQATNWGWVSTKSLAFASTCTRFQSRKFGWRLKVFLARYGEGFLPMYLIEDLNTVWAYFRYTNYMKLNLFKSKRLDLLLPEFGLVRSLGPSMDPLNTWNGTERRKMKNIYHGVNPGPWTQNPSELDRSHWRRPLLLGVVSINTRWHTL